MGKLYTFTYFSTYREKRRWIYALTNENIPIIDKPMRWCKAVRVFDINAMLDNFGNCETEVHREVRTLIHARNRTAARATSNLYLAAAAV